MPDDLKLAVGKLVSFACRSGDLLHGGLAGPSAREGQATHKAIQAERSADTSAEVAVKTVIRVGDIRVQLQGRIDLVSHSEDTITLGEIKSTYVPADRVPQSSKDLHAAQLKVYGYCYLREQPADSARAITLELIWFNIKTGQRHTEQARYAFAELESFTLAALDNYLQWHARVSDNRRRMLSSASDLHFPLGDFRKGQREMAAAIYCGARDSANLLVEAPTGIGKTISAVFAASKALGEKHVDRFIYLTAKNSGREAAARALTQLRHAGLVLTAITITAKKTTCHCSSGRCALDEQGRCPLTIGFFDRLPAARRELIGLGIITAAQLDQVAQRHQLCPFELIQQMLPWVDAIVCDYNYVFDPLVRFGFFEETATHSLLLVDEAHNLLERARSMYSAQLNQYAIRAAAAECKSVHSLLHKDWQNLSRAMTRWAKAVDEPETADTDTPTAIGKAVMRCIETLADPRQDAPPLSERVADQSKEIYRYAVIEDLFSEHHRTLTLKREPRDNTRGNRGNIVIQLRCLDASANLEKRFSFFRSAVVFSATLRPRQFYLQSLGLPDNTTTLALNSPFRASQQLTGLCSYIDTRYRARKQSLPHIIDILHATYQARPGNYQVFFPSYTYMEMAYQVFTENYPTIPSAIQQRDSSEAERETFLARFTEHSKLLSFAIMGGIYGEGVDYTGTRLIGSIVVGTGLPSMSLEQKLIERHYSERQLDGFDYAGRYPGLTRVLQTAGRVIRSERDRGVVLLIDSRFNSPFYRALYPAHWQVSTCANLQVLERQLKLFWSQPATD